MNTMVETRGLAGRRLLAIAVLIGGMTACDEDPVDLGGHEEGDVAGFRIVGVQQLPGGSRPVLFTYTGPTTALADTLSLPQGASVDVEIVWLDASGGVVDVDAEEHGWELNENHSAITSFVPSDTEDWRGTFTMLPLAPGATVYGGFSVTLLHGDEEEFETSQLVAAVGD